MSLSSISARYAALRIAGVRLHRRDRDGAKLLLDRLADTWKRLRLIWADGGYAGQLITWVRSLRKRKPVRVQIDREAIR